MTDKDLHVAFSEDERAALHSLAEMFGAKKERDALRQLLGEGVTLREIVLAYRTQKRMIGMLKATAGLVVVIGGAFAILKGVGLFGGDVK